MTRKLIFGLLVLGATSVNAQSTSSGKFKILGDDQTEVGLNAGFTITQTDGDNKLRPGLGVGGYVRKALDPTFSIRLGLGYYLANGENTKAYNTYNGKQIGKFSSSILSGTGDLIIGLGTTGRFENLRRTIQPYVFGGAGWSYQRTNVTTSDNVDHKNIKPGTNKGIGGLIQGGVGVNFRVSDKMSFGIEERAVSLLGGRQDWLDGVVRQGKDLTLLTTATLAFNIGDPKKPAKFWTNPAEQMQNDIADLIKRPVYDPKDTDGDGIIDMIDQEKESPAGARVDTRGVALDSDGDGYPDYKDKEPFSPIGYTYDKQGVAQVPKPNYATTEDVNRIVTTEIDKLKKSLPSSSTIAGGMSDWFLPMIHFDLNSATIKQNEYSNLAAVAQVLKSNPSINVVVSGHTDRLASDGYNQGLSYRRASNAVDILVKRFGIDRSRLIINYSGEGTNLIPTSAGSYMNRRVEFRVAKGESEMSAPAKSFKGNKAGY